jgi:hypothetical protein
MLIYVKTTCNGLILKSDTVKSWEGVKRGGTSWKDISLKMNTYIVA